MNFHQLTLPIPKRQSADSSLRVFPIDQIPGSDDKIPFIGIYTGLSVEICDRDAIKLIHSGGFFGLSTKTKNTPQALAVFPRVKNINQLQYEQKLQWNEQFHNQNENLVMVNLLPLIEDNSDEIANEKVETEEKMAEDNETSVENDENSENEINESEPTETTETKLEPELNLVVDPFPIEETLALLLEEAFFLHYSLRCLRILNFEQTQELNTNEILTRFCQNDSKFFARFVVYHYYRSKNWVVKSGLKFGGDFLLYYKGPSYYHATYVVLVSDSTADSNHLDVQSNYRVSESTNKEIILANVVRPNDLEYSNPSECLKRFSEFKITEILPKRFLLNQLMATQQKT